MQISRNALAAAAALIVATGLALLLALDAGNISTVPNVARGSSVEAAFAALGQIDPWTTFAVLVAMLALLFYTSLPARDREQESFGLAELSDQITAQHSELSQHLLGLREDIAREVEKATGELEGRIGETLRAGINAQDHQVRKTLDHFNARAGWQIQQLSAKLNGLPPLAQDADRATPP
jgi:hypothetical protein